MSASTSIEARLAALEKKTPPRSTSFRDNLKSVSPTPSPPVAKPLWQASTTGKADPVKEKLLAARSGLARIEPKRRDFSDPLKQGILAAKQNLKIQDTPKEKKEDELKMSILNARKGLKRATSREEPERPLVERRSVTPTVKEDVKREKSADVERGDGSAMKEVPLEKESSASPPVEEKEPNKSPPPSKASLEPVSKKPVENPPSKGETSLTAATEKSTVKPATSPKPQKVEPLPPMQKPIVQHTEPSKRDNDSPTPQKKLPTSNDAKSDTSVKTLPPKLSSTQPMSLPTATETKPLSFKGRYFI